MLSRIAVRAPLLWTRVCWWASAGWKTQRAWVGHVTYKRHRVEGQRIRAHERRDDDDGYLTLLAAHPEGFVASIGRNNRRSTAWARHATCRTTSNQIPHKGPWAGA